MAKCSSPSPPARIFRFSDPDQLAHREILGFGVEGELAPTLSPGPERQVERGVLQASVRDQLELPGLELRLHPGVVERRLRGRKLLHCERQIEIQRVEQ